MTQKIPVMYSFRRCPFAIRARLALYQSGQKVELREVKLSQKPGQLHQCSKKATVPVLVLSDTEVIDESLDIMNWALQLNDPLLWLEESISQQTRQLIDENDGPFKINLDLYKYSDRNPQFSQLQYRQRAEVFVQKLEALLLQNRFLLSNRVTLVDIALMPFIRQFAGVDRVWFENCEYQRVRDWLNGLLNSDLFKSVMKKYDVWQAGNEKVYFPD